MIYNFFIFFVSLYFLILSADLFVKGAASLAIQFKVSQIVIGLTLVSIGTSLPELFTNIFASFQNHTDIALGNIIGSNLFNLLFILGVSGLINPIIVKKNTTYKEIPFSLFTTLLFLILVNDRLVCGKNFENIFSRTDGFIFFIFYLGFIYYVIKLAKIEPVIEENIKVYSLNKTLFFILFGLSVLIVSSKILVWSSVNIARLLKVSESFISLTIVSIGTSLPELVTSTVAAFRKNSDIAIGNIVGSNIFNLLFILGISGIIKNLPFSLNLNFDVIYLIYATFMLFLLMFLGRKHILGRKGSSIMIFTYILYIFLISLRK